MISKGKLLCFLTFVLAVNARMLFNDVKARMLMNDVKPCPEECTCIENVVNCNERSLGIFPEKLPVDTEELYVKDNGIYYFPKEKFNMPQLRLIDASMNHIDFIRNDTMSDLKRLRTLVLTNNHVKEVQANGFKGLEKLRSLYLDSNDLDMGFHTIDFSDLTGLKLLTVSHNGIRIWPDHIFESMPSLEKLDVSDNFMPIVNTTTFGKLPNLKILDISENYLKKIEPGSFDGLPNLELLSMQMNEIDTIEKGTFSILKKLKYLFIYNQKLQCTCDFISELNELKRSGVGLDIDGSCAFPKNLEKRPIQWITNKEACQ